MSTPGIKVVPMRLMGEHDINSVYYTDVRVPASCLVGVENEGWGLLTNQLNHERVTLCSPGIIERSLDEVLDWTRRVRLVDGRRVIDQEWVQVDLARVRAKLDFLKLINWKVAWSATQGRLEVADASTTKVFGTEFYLEAFRLMMEIIGQHSYLTRHSSDAVLGSRLERLYRSLIILTFGGGTNEIQRDLIAMFGLGMPRSR
jgi:alkylation response protein AidB-like acyl-CoA dehydrogenase